MTLNESILTNLQTELNMARAKRFNNINANLPTDRIEERIAVLGRELDTCKRRIIEEGLREAQNKP